jgi:L-lactate dehydrogenase complex protein LldG
MPMETGDRRSFLSRLGGALASPPQHGSARPIPAWDGVVPEVGYSADLSDRAARFCEALAAVAGHARRVGSPAALRELLMAIRDRHGIGRAVVSADPECEGVAATLRELGIEAAPLASVEQAAAVDLGITGAVCGIALTGSIVVDAARAGGRTASLLPAVHLALLRADEVLATPGELLRGLASRPGGLPSNLVLITGPSRSADIELELTLGVHGPRELWVALL